MGSLSLFGLGRAWGKGMVVQALIGGEEGESGSDWLGVLQAARCISVPLDENSPSSSKHPLSDSPYLQHGVHLGRGLGASSSLSQRCTAGPSPALFLHSRRTGYETPGLYLLKDEGPACPQRSATAAQGDSVTTGKTTSIKMACQ